MKALALFLLPLALLGADPKKALAKKDLPVPVLTAFEKAYPNAKLKACTRETRNGQTVYELESLDGKAGRDLIYAADGTVLEVEETLSPAELPEAVRKAVAAAHPKARIQKAEKLTKASGVTYEVVVKEGGKAFELALDAQGKPTPK